MQNKICSHKRKPKEWFEKNIRIQANIQPKVGMTINDGYDNIGTIIDVRIGNEWAHGGYVEVEFKFDNEPTLNEHYCYDNWWQVVRIIED